MKNIIALALVAIMAVSCSQEETKQQKLEKLKTEIAKLVKEKEALEKELATTDTGKVKLPVRTMELASSTFKRSIEIQGAVESDQNVIISAEVVGRVVDVYVKEGQKVSKGQLIARVNGDITASSMLEVENALKFAETNFQKQKRLREQNVGTEMQLLQAENQRDALKKQLETLRSQYAKYSITSPISGTIDEISINAGENIMPGMPVARVVDVNQLKITADVSERYMRAIKVGDSALLSFPGFPEKLGTKISAVGQVINNANRTFSITINIPVNKLQLKPNQLVMIGFYDYVKTDAIVVPSNLVAKEGENFFVYTVSNDKGKSIAKRVTVKTGESGNGRTVIEEGLKAGDMLVTENGRNLQDGDNVTVLK